jgi:hypothetical protein
MIGWRSNWISAIASLKLTPVDTAATGPPLGEAVVDPENALLEHRGQDNFIERLWRYKDLV